MCGELILPYWAEVDGYDSCGNVDEELLASCIGVFKHCIL